MATLLIFLHGSGGTGRDIRDYLDLPLDAFQHRTFGEVAEMANIDIITPTASERPYTPMNREPTRGWFDRSPNFIQLGCDDVEDTHGVNESIHQVFVSIYILYLKHMDVITSTISYGCTTKQIFGCQQAVANCI